jgi:hypothetical protein
VGDLRFARVIIPLVRGPLVAVPDIILPCMGTWGVWPTVALWSAGTEHGCRLNCWGENLA